MPDYLTGLNCAIFTVPILAATVAIILTVLYLDHRDKRRPRS
jgi:hypothetical protein